MSRLKLISRRTLILFLVMTASWGFLAYRSWNFNRPCREWKQRHPGLDPDALNETTTDGTTIAELNPCNIWY